MKNKAVLFEQIMSYRNISGFSLRSMIFDAHAELTNDEQKADVLTKEYIDSIYTKFFENED